MSRVQPQNTHYLIDHKWAVNILFSMFVGKTTQTILGIAAAAAPPVCDTDASCGRTAKSDAHKWTKVRIKSQSVAVDVCVCLLATSICLLHLKFQYLYSSFCERVSSSCEGKAHKRLEVFVCFTLINVGVFLHNCRKIVHHVCHFTQVFLFTSPRFYICKHGL